ncbi:hypothetical protein [Pseudomonas lactis]|uniref:hypothetical protein n=1 Tax=Pseudomonas lactis TaxID=1615674 RepID=UPI001472DBBE|nr:hypothetical protein [Pseudomonas lactis]NNA49070.1 hypothetical protein [Pseudomonas lactis]
MRVLEPIVKNGFFFSPANPEKRYQLVQAAVVVDLKRNGTESVSSTATSFKESS